MCSWELKRDLLSLSLSLSLSCDKEKKTNAVRYHQYKHTLKASEVSVVLRPTFEVEIIKCKQLINQCGVLVWSLSRIYWFRV